MTQALLERLKLARLKVDKDDGRKEHLRYLLKMSKFPEAYRRPEIMSRSNLTSDSGKKERNKGKVPPFKA